MQPGKEKRRKICIGKNKINNRIKKASRELKPQLFKVTTVLT